MWEIRKTSHYESRERRYIKKHPRELKAVLENLEAYLQSLQDEEDPRRAKSGFIHYEPHGVMAIDQSGGGRALAPTRLYVYPHQQTLYLLTIGDKRSQKEDIKYCSAVVKELRKRKEEEGED